MDEKEQEDWLDRQLREAAPYIDDQGFSARVLQQLPAPRRGRNSLRAVVLLGNTLLASALVYVLSNGGHFLVIAATQMMMLPTLWILVLALGSGILVMAGGIIAAICKTRELQFLNR